MIAPALPEDEDYLREPRRRASVLDRDADVAAAVRERHPDGIDALLDLVSYAPDGFDAHAAALKDDGRGASPLSAAGEGPGRTNVMADADARRTWSASRRCWTPAPSGCRSRTRYALDQAGEALHALGATHTQGKLAIYIS